ncbi:hypothetical protein FBQ97_22045 [Acidobacteria bacterium ACD]|nr:hypothetical protein [Acidobacteria bacterium ACD]
MDAKSNDPSVPADEDLLLASRFRVVRRYRQLPSGTVVAREIVEHPGAVTILPLVDDGRGPLLVPLGDDEEDHVVETVG